MSHSIKIKKVGSDRIFEIDIHRQGENSQPCPDCAQDRRKKSAKSFSYNAEKAQGYCNHCQSRFHEYKPYSKEVFYEMPKFENKTQLSEKAVQYAHSRMINSETLIKMEISSAEEFMPQSNKAERCICFPYYRNGELINVKYRDGKKNFKLSKGAELIWYNYDAIINAKEIIIVEGEWDALSFMADGFENVISVPNGANVGKMSYLDETITLFDTIEKIYIAVDNDEKGLELRAELIRRFGFEKCHIVEFNEYKDANDCLMNNGYGVLKEFINKARVPKIEGILEAEDYLSDIMDLYEKGMQKGKITGLKWLDTLITWETKRLATWTGTPSSGKSEFVDMVNCKLNFEHNWKVAYWTPENFPTQYHYSKIAEKLTGKTFKKDFLTEAEFWEAHEYIAKNFFWVNLDNDFTLENILDKFKYLVKTKGVKICVIDPFNKLEYRLGAGQTKLDYISQVLDKIIWFAKVNDVLVHLIAHPRKLEKDKDGKFPMPTMYDIAGSADFWNKTDYGIAMSRKQDGNRVFINKGSISVQKVKFKNLGEQGIADHCYNFKNGRFEEDFQPNDPTVNESSSWDNHNWITAKNIDPFND